MFMPSTVPELRGRENLPTFLQRFRTWASISGCDSALDSEIIVRTSGTPRAELERVHDPRLVDISLNAWQSLSEGNPCTGLKDFGMYECTRGLEDSVYHNTAPHEQPRGLEYKSRCKNS